MRGAEQNNLHPNPILHHYGGLQLRIIYGTSTVRPQVEEDPNWLTKQLEEAANNVSKWPRWKLQEAGIDHLFLADGDGGRSVPSEGSK